MLLRDQRALAGDNWEAFISAAVRHNLAQPVEPTTDTGYKSYDHGRLFLPGTINYCTNSSFEVGTDGLATGWEQLAASTSTAGTITYSLVPGRTGGLAQRIQLTAAAGDSADTYAFRFLTATGTFAAADAVTASLYAKGSATGVTCSLYVDKHDAAGTILGGASVAITPTTSWQRASVSYTVSKTNTSRASIWLYVTGISAGGSFDITLDDALPEKSAFLSPYFDGSYSNCTWATTPNASTSTRTVSSLILPSPWTTLPATGTIAARSIPLAANTSYSAEALCGLYEGATGRAVLGHKGGKHNMNVATDSTSVATFTASSTNVSIGRWDASGTYLHFNGTAATAGAAPTVGGALDRFLFGTAAYLQGPAVVSSSCLTAAEAVLLDAVMRNGSVPDVYRFFCDRGYTDTTLIPLVGDSLSYKVVA